MCLELTCFEHSMHPGQTCWLVDTQQVFAHWDCHLPQGSLAGHTQPKDPEGQAWEPGLGPCFPCVFSLLY